MELPRRKFLHLAAGTATLCSSLRGAWALDYPAKPVRVIVPFAAGGSTDIAGRLICQWLSERTGQQFIYVIGKYGETAIGQVEFAG